MSFASSRAALAYRAVDSRAANSTTILRGSSPSDFWTAYQHVAASNSLATDILTNGAIHVVSDTLAQLTERTSLAPRVSNDGPDDGPDFQRNLRFGSFGAADGAVSHLWYTHARVHLRHARALATRTRTRALERTHAHARTPTARGHHWERFLALDNVVGEDGTAAQTVIKVPRVH